MLHVPICQQVADYSCGAAALYACLLYWRVSVERETALWASLGTNQETGTEPDRIEGVAKAYGLRATYRHGMGLGDLRRALRKRQTVILSLQAWPAAPVADWSQVWDDGHYVVLVGLKGDRAVFMDPSTPTAYTYLATDQLISRWHDVDATGQRLSGMGIVIAGKERLDSFPDDEVPLR